MDDVVKRFKLRRKKRLEDRNGIHFDSVDKYKYRRVLRMQEREDSGVGWAYGVAESNGIDTEGMSPKEVFEALEKEGVTSGGGKNSGNGAKKEKVSKENSGESSRKKDQIKKSTHRNHEYDGSGYKGKAGEVKSGKSGNLSPKSETAKRISVDDALDEVRKYKETNGEKGLPKNSLTDFIDKDGKLTPERQKVHDELVQNFFKSKTPYDGKPTMIMSGGGPASGKSFVEKGARSKFGDDTTITVDPDKIKEMLPGYTDMAIETDEAAGYYHEESSALAKRIYQYAVDNGINVVYDGTGDGSINSVKKKIETARKAGYAVKGEYVTVDVDGENGALVRNQKRYESGKEKFESGESDVPPRKPKESHVRQIHAAVSDIIPEVASLYDELKIWDNNQGKGEPRTLVATCKRDGDIKVENGQEDLMNRFLKKGEKGYRYSNGKVHN